VARITSRICGICAIGHTLASVKATEDALGIAVSEQTVRLRTLLKHAENVDSHILHVYVLVAPDLLGVPSVFPLVETAPEVVERALRLKRLAHEWGSAIGGRTTHPTRVVPGGFSRLPVRSDLEALRAKLEAALPEVAATVETVAALADRIPGFERPTEYLALASDASYALYDGHVESVLADGDRERYDVAEYRSFTNEYVVEQSTAKFTRNRLPSYAVGALARFNVNHTKVHPEAKQAAERLGLSAVCFNPYMNTVAQVVEIVHSVHESLEIIDRLLADGIADEPPVAPTRSGAGVGSVEVPRGVLFHSYVYDDDLACVSADCVIPTNQNHGNIQGDFDVLVPRLLAAGAGEEEIRRALEMLVRAYDPCISCSTHALDVEFVR
jgi:coenzyme F420-reducing hydrogenase alpha subunit